MFNKTLISSNTGNMEDEINYSFTPYQKPAERIETILSAMNFYKMIGKVGGEYIRLNIELSRLQSEITNIQKRNRCH